jgi:hypothetical protein
MKIKTIANQNSHSFEKEVNEFLKEKEELLLHKHTVFAVTTDTFLGKTITMYSAIFYGEL